MTMPEIANVIFTYKEVATALIKAQDIHEGVWALFIRFGLSAANAGANDEELKPCAIIPILEIGLQKAEKENNVSVDAAKVNPAQGKKGNQGRVVPTAKQ
jgi:hypothetical protein